MFAPDVKHVFGRECSKTGTLTPNTRSPTLSVTEHTFSRGFRSAQSRELCQTLQAESISTQKSTVRDFTRDRIHKTRNRTQNRTQKMKVKATTWHSHSVLSVRTARSSRRSCRRQRIPAFGSAPNVEPGEITMFGLDTWQRLVSVSAKSSCADASLLLSFRSRSRPPPASASVPWRAVGTGLPPSPR